MRFEIWISICEKLQGTALVCFTDDTAKGENNSLLSLAIPLLTSPRGRVLRKCYWNKRIVASWTRGNISYKPHSMKNVQSIYILIRRIRVTTRFDLTIIGLEVFLRTLFY